jgi:hypothetical protein
LVDARHPARSRRAFLGGAGASALTLAMLVRGGAPAGAATSPGAATIDLPPGAGTLGQGEFQLFAAEDLNFQTLIALGGAGINSAVGEVITAVNQANAAPGGASYQSLYDAMIATGNRMIEGAEDAVRRKRLVTARDRYLRAAQYYNQALFWVLATSTPSAEAEVFTVKNDAWAHAAKRMDPVWEPLAVRYRGFDLPAWFLRAPGASGRRPTLVMNNGSDGQTVDMLAQGGAAALARGWNVVVFEGPGQGRMLFERKVPFTPDWHEVVSSVVDATVKRGDVDTKRLALIGVSFGGLLVMRAVAFEHRFAAVVSDPGSVDTFRAFPESLQEIAAGGTKDEVNGVWDQFVVPGVDPAQAFSLKKRLEIFSTAALEEARAGKVPSDWYDLSRRIQAFTLGDLAPKVATPTLVVDYDLETFYPGQPQELYDALPGKKDYAKFTVEEGAQYHDAPIGSQWHGEVVMDWLERRVGR